MSFQSKPNFFHRQELQRISLLLIGLVSLSFFSSNLSSIQAQGQTQLGRIQPLLLEKAAQTPVEIVNVIIQKTVSDNSIENEVTKLGGTVTKDLHIINAIGAELSASQIPELSQIPGVKAITWDAPAKSSSTDCAGCIDTTSLLNNYNREINADKVWNQSVKGVQQPWLQGQGVTVAVVDSGIVSQNDFKNPLNNNLRVLKAVSVHNSVSTSDAYGHGTHVSGIIGGSGINSSGEYIGVAPKVNLVSVKVSDDTGSVSSSDIVSGLQWINDNKDKYNIRVVNISINSTTTNSYNVDPIDAAAEILWFNGVVVVVSAGNNGNSTLYPPANDPFVITVGAVDDAGTLSLSDDKVASFSAWGKDEMGHTKPDLVTPARKLVSVLASGGDTLAKLHPSAQLSGGLASFYFVMSGTSMAAPVAAGAVALLLQSEPNLNPDQVKNRLKATALQNNSRGSWDNRSSWSNYNANTAGAGYLDIQAAINQSYILGTANTGLPASQMLWSGGSPVNWSSVNWSSVNWSSVNWSSVNWSSVNWSSVNWSDYWGSNS